MEIGSEFWWGNLTKKNNSFPLPMWLSKMDNINLTSSGRGALSLLLKNINVSNKVVLLPSYICESVLLPFEKEGYEIRFYHINSDLTFNIGSMNTDDIGIFLHLGYFGFNTNNSLKDIIKKLQKQSVVTIEDVTHTLFSERNNFESDYYIGSIRKWFGIPSGGFLADNFEKKYFVSKPHINFVDKRIQGFDSKTKYINTGIRELKPYFLEKFNEAENILDHDTNPYSIDQLSENIILQYPYHDLIKTRRQNYNYLLKNLKEFNEINIIFNNLPKNTCPIFFPVLINNERDSLRQYLINNDIYCPVHWPIPETTKNHLNGTTSLIYNSILSIPCDQRYNKADMDKIIKHIREWTKLKQ